MVCRCAQAALQLSSAAVGPRAISCLLLVVAAGFSATCSGGGAPASTFSSETGGGAPDLGGSGGGSASSSSSSAAASSSSSAASSSSSASSSSGGDASCDARDTCVDALELSSVDGDQGSDTRTFSGSTSRWLEVEVVDSIAYRINGVESYTATLQSPTGLGFDLYVYPGGVNGPSCLAAPVLATGTPESVSATWPDVLLQNDDRWITLEVRAFPGQTCTPTAQWTLTVQGNTAP